LVLTNVTPAPLDEVTGESFPMMAVVVAAKILGELGEGVVEEANQGAKGVGLPRVRSCCDQQQMSFWVGGKAFHQAEALMSALPGGLFYAAVGLVNDHKLGACAQEVIPTTVGLNEVGGYDHEAVLVEDGAVDG
jgi:hypothetical protein